MNNENRILGRLVANEMSLSDIEKISGGMWLTTGMRATGSYGPDAGPVSFDSRYDDTTWDN